MDFGLGLGLGLWQNETFGKNPGKKQRKRIEAAIAKAQRVATEN